MRDKLRTLLGIETEEESMVSMLLAQSVFLGIYLGAFDIAAHSLLLSAFDEKTMARGYVISGITGIILTSLYSWAQLRLKFRNLAIINLIVVAVLTVFLWLAINLFRSGWPLFMAFVMLGPLNILASLGLLGTKDRLFALGEGQKILRHSDTALIAGIILISYSVPVLFSLKFQVKDLILLSAFSVIIALILQIFLAKYFTLVTRVVVDLPQKPGTIKSVFAALRKDKLFRITGIFAALSVLTLFFIQYLFMAFTREQYPDAGNLAEFLGLFTGTVMIFILLIKQDGITYLIQNYGLRMLLFSTPVIVTVLAALATGLGIILGYSPASALGFSVFFIIIAFSRIISKSSKEIIESPSLKIFFQATNQKLNLELQSDLIRTLNEIMVLFSGVILTALGLVRFIRLIHFSMVLTLTGLITVYAAYRLFKGYKSSVLKAVEDAALEESIAEVSGAQYSFTGRFIGNLTFRKDYYRLISGDYSLLNRRENKWYFEKMIDYGLTNNDINLLPALNKVSSNEKLEEQLRKRSTEAVSVLMKLTNSHRTIDEKITETIRTLVGTRKPQITQILRLLRDNSGKSKRMAIYMIGKFQIRELIPEVCDCLNIQGLATDASEVLKAFGSQAEDELIKYFLVTSGNIKLSKRIIKILGRTCTARVRGFMFARLWSNSRQLKELAAVSLLKGNFKPSEKEKIQLDQLISDVIGSVTWTLSARISFERDKNVFLLEIAERELTRWYDFLFNLLSITYESGTISLIRENLNKRTMESTCYALEMTDIVVSDSLKPKLISLFDIVPDEDKLKNLLQFFPGGLYESKRLLEEILNRDYNLVSLWTKACTLRSIQRIEGGNMSESVTALLFSPEEIIQEEAARLIARSDPEIYLSARERLPEATRKRLGNIIEGKTNTRELLFDKVLFLTRLFEGILEEELLSLASDLKYTDHFEPDTASNNGDMLIWPLPFVTGQPEVYILFRDKSEIPLLNYSEKGNQAFYILSLDAVEDFNLQFPDKSFTILKYIDSNEYHGKE